MTILIAGLVVFFAVHSIRIFAEDRRSAWVARLGEGGYKGVYSVVSVAGLVLMIWGYGQARAAPIVLWDPPLWTRHLSALLMLFAFVMVTAAYMPHNRIKSALKHPMLIGVKVWAAGHLLANGTLADLLLFGTFLVWAVLDFRAARARDRREHRVYARARGTLVNDTLTIVIGAVAWAAFALYLHVWLIGVRPFVS